MSKLLDRPGIILEDDTFLDSTGNAGGDHCVKIFNNETTAMHVVVMILKKATGCDDREALLEMEEAHVRGWAIVHYASEKECNKAASIIKTVGVQAVVEESP